MMHQSECLKAQAERNALRDAYAEKWPNYCKTCEGAGGRSYSYDPSPSGVGLSAGWFTEFDPCRDCVEKGVCPRCAAKWTDAENPPEVCPACGWDARKADAMPPAHECCCWIEDYEEPADPTLYGYES